MKQTRNKQRMKLKDFQKKLVNDVVERLKISSLYVFQAPTGTGKTFMTANIIDKIVQTYKEDITFIYIAPSVNSLHKQGYQKITSYLSKKKSNLSNYNTSISLPNNYFNPNEVYFFGWDSLYKKNNNLTKENFETESLTFWQVLEETKNKDIKIALVIDEQHRAKNKKAATELIKRIKPWKQIEMSATLDKMNDCDYKIKYADAIAEKIIKKNVIANPSNYDNNLEQKERWKIILNEAIKKQKEIRRAYAKRNLKNLNPLLIIQLTDEAKKKDTYLDADFVSKFLEEKLNIPQSTIAIWLSGRHESADGRKLEKSDIENDVSHIDFLIFKQAAAIGWDIPRANVYVKFRNVKSQSFQIQTLGRILRNPFMRYFDNQLIDCAFVFTDDDAMIRKIVATWDSNEEKNSYFLKKSFKQSWKDKKIKLYKYQLENKNQNFAEIYKEWLKTTNDNKDYKKNLDYTFNEAKKYNPKLQLLKKGTKMLTMYERNIIKSSEENVEQTKLSIRKNESDRTLLEIYMSFQNIINDPILESIIKQKSANEGVKRKKIFSFIVDNPSYKKNFSQPLKEIRQNLLNKKNFYELAEYINLNEDWVNGDAKQPIHAYNANLINQYVEKKSYNFFDSNDEKNFYFSLNHQRDQIKKLKFISRNTVSNKGFFVWYFNKDKQLKKYYPDFLVLTTDKLLFIEIKDKGDRDPERYHKIDAINKPEREISNFQCEAYLGYQIDPDRSGLSNFQFEQEENSGFKKYQDIFK